MGRIFLGASKNQFSYKSLQTKLIENINGDHLDLKV